MSARAIARDALYRQSEVTPHLSKREAVLAHCRSTDRGAGPQNRAPTASAAQLCCGETVRGGRLRTKVSQQFVGIARDQWRVRGELVAFDHLAHELAIPENPLVVRPALATALNLANVFSSSSAAS